MWGHVQTSNATRFLRQFLNFLLIDSVNHDQNILLAADFGGDCGVSLVAFDI